MQHLIRQDMTNPIYQVYQDIIEGFRDIEKGHYIKSTGDWQKDKKLFQKKEENNWSS